MKATQNVLRHYSVETTQKGADFIALAGVASMIVGTRIGAYNLRVRAERESATVHQFRPTVVEPRRQPAPATPQAPAAPQRQEPPSPRVEVDLSGDGSGGGF